MPRGRPLKEMRQGKGGRGEFLARRGWGGERAREGGSEVCVGSNKELRAA